MHWTGSTRLTGTPPRTPPTGCGALPANRGIESRTGQLIAGATDELLLAIGHESIFTDQLARQLRDARERDVTVIVGTIDADLRATVRDALPGVEVFVSGLEWLSRSRLPNDETEISRLL